MDPVLGFKVKDLPKYFSGYYRFQTNIKAERLIGAEFEIEGSNLPNSDQLAYYWRAEADGSLRGPSAEFVLTRPVSEEVFKEKAFPYLTKQIKRNKAKLKISGRCSTHIHMNVQNMYLYQVWALAALYYAFENLAFILAGPQRSGNLFCIGANNSDYISDEMVRGAMVGNITIIGSENKYSAVNFTSIKKYGSLEFRAMRGTLEADEVYPWVDFLIALRNHAASLEPPDVANLFNDISSAGCANFVRDLLGKDSDAWRIIKRAAGTNDHINDLIYDGISAIQRVVYEPTWAELLIKGTNESIESYVNRLRENKGPGWLSDSDRTASGMFRIASPQLRNLLSSSFNNGWREPPPDQLRNPHIDEEIQQTEELLRDLESRTQRDGLRSGSVNARWPSEHVEQRANSPLAQAYERLRRERLEQGRRNDTWYRVNVTTTTEE